MDLGVQSLDAAVAKLSRKRRRLDDVHDWTRRVLLDAEEENEEDSFEALVKAHRAAAEVPFHFVES